MIVLPTPAGIHAEIEALRKGPKPAGCTLYVTLEPCSFHGRTPSCARAFVTAGINTVYIGIIDPDPRNNGRGVELLRSAGVTVEVGVLAAQARAELLPYLGKAR